MARPRTYKTEAVVLKQTPFGEADRVLTFCTPGLGKLRAIAKGVRRTTSRKGGHLELLNRVSISLAQGRNLDVVTEAQVVQSYRGLRDDLQLLSRALYLAELVDGFGAERSANHAAYRLLVEALAWLEHTTLPDLLVRHFEMHLLDRSGYRPELYRCVECREELEPGDHVFNCRTGGVLCPACRPGSGDPLTPISLISMKVLRFIQKHDEYEEVSRLRPSARTMAELERLLSTYVRFLMDRELRTAEFVHLVSLNSQEQPSHVRLATRSARHRNMQSR